MKKMNVDCNRPIGIATNGDDWKFICLFYADKEEPEIIGYYKKEEILDMIPSGLKTVKFKLKKQWFEE